ncbi:MAG: replication initiation protein [Propionibacteriaceae bacterium]|nr:replication initiation protein [Propionibacteriaceae bacterium]
MKDINKYLPFKSKTPKVYKHKKLNNANFGDFTLNDYQVLLHLITKIGGVDEFGKYLQPEQLQREHILTAKEFSEVFNTDISYSYKLLYQACKKLMKTSITLEKLELSEIWEINICSMAKYNKNKGSITIEFTDRIMPYLAQVKQRFVIYNLKEISNFGSLYTTRLYELIQEFKETGWLVKSVEQLREVFAVGNKFKAYGDFKKKTFAHACNEINTNYDIGLTFEEIKEGRKVVAVKFSFKKTIVNKVANQKTGKITNVYEKPKTRSLQRIKNNVTLEPKIVAKQSIPASIESTSIKDVVSSFLAKLKPQKK